MADTLKKLYRGQPGTANATLYTVPASTKTIIKSVTIANTSASAATITLKAGGQVFVPGMSIDANSIVVINDVGILEAGELIEGLQGTASAISVWISGMEVA